MQKATETVISESSVFTQVRPYPAGLQLCLLGEEPLREVSNPVIYMNSREVHRLIEDMLGVFKRLTSAGQRVFGFTAIQFAQPLQIFLMNQDENGLNGRGLPLVIINPVIVNVSRKTIVGDERCSSAPGLLFSRERHTWVQLSYISQDNRPVIRELFFDYEARMIQHAAEHFQARDIWTGNKL